MQRENPDYTAACEAFARAIEDQSYDLREESLANLGWCYYAAAGETADGDRQRDPQRLRQTIDTFQQLRKENPNSDYIDRAFFYSGEAAYGLGKLDQAIGFYNKFIALPSSKQSPLRCDALYALGIAQQEADQTQQAIASFDQLLKDCADSELAVDVHLRLGDLYLLQRRFDAAVDSFGRAIEQADQKDDQSYAIFRQAYALVQSGKPNDAAARYDQLQKEFPDSPYAANATLASGQSLYRGGQTDQAAERFEKVLSQNNPAAATEAAHWLVRIQLSRGEAAAAAAIARKQLDAGAEGDFAVDLKVDLAEALALIPDSIAESVDVAEQAYRSAPEDALAPRALYNAAFSALQINQFPRAIELATEFLQKFSEDELAPDVRFIVAESQLLSGDAPQAIESFRELLKQTAADHPQRPMWVLRTATAMNAGKQYDQTVALIDAEAEAIKEPQLKAEAKFLAGQAQLMAGQPEQAATSFAAAAETAPQWQRHGEAMLLRGTALLNAGQTDQAKSVWQNLVSAQPETAMADQARYKLAQLASDAGEHDRAIELYTEIIQAERDQGLIPYALYGRGWSQMQSDNHQQALASLDRIIGEKPQHPVADDALIARGISHRTLGNDPAAREDLERYLGMEPQGNNLGHALYELALVLQSQDKPELAAERLQQLIERVPDYPGMDKVLYELGWSLRDSGKEDAAEQRFEALLKRSPESPMAAEAAYYLGQRAYRTEQWDRAANFYQTAANNATDPAMSEKSLYRLGWSQFKGSNLDQAEEAFRSQFDQHPEGKLALDALMMIGESAFKGEHFERALKAYGTGRDRIQASDDNADTVRGPADRQVRELILLHGGQSAAQLQRWDEAIGWYDELKTRFPATGYLPQVFYELGFAHQQKNDNEKALNFFSQVAEGYRTEVAARARFMMGEIYFAENKLDQAIPQFQRVMFGFGAEKAPEDIQNWQAKSGFEAARCSEQLMQSAGSEDAKAKSRRFAIQFYQYVVQKHPGHELAKKSAERLEALQRS
ncbi:tetratricopeptide repeat protein [Roseiconus nitratireducens]|uniref:Tetratricopeptide repeat protein n=2 Tax=Roseiconus nitratireducens TaxID=2605748 RepID=A0A5M6DE16_9BACT|nr:tetratricopeptide repeat protein [Roseiconus nitratireducens]